ncbi:MAG TPA: TonB-dependent receptor, partial [Parvularcula sp.]|nr:TonB-dependent receptor [Parvularcula sp.]
TRHVGGEAEIGADLPFGLSIDAQASYGRHTYRFDRPVLSAPQATEAISFGDDVDTAPRWIAGARARWRSGDARFDAELEWAHLGRYFLDAAN